MTSLQFANEDNIAGILSRFQDVSVVIAGDVMLDRYWWGRVSRISPEAPVPIVNLEQSSFAPGGAANVAANVASLGGTPLLAGAVGKDAEGQELRVRMKSLGISVDYLFASSERPTTVKTRVIAHSQQVVRVDREDASPLSEPENREMVSRIVNLLDSANILVISDYAKGLLSSALLRTIIDECLHRQVPVLVDPKGKDYTKYSGATLVTPNRQEAISAAALEGSDVSAVESAGRLLLEGLDVENLLITQGEDGMTLFRRSHEPLWLKASAHQVYDVTGAGDTVIAALALSLGAGASLVDAATIANIAAGMAVEQLGTTAVPLDELMEKARAGQPAPGSVALAPEAACEAKGGYSQ